MQRRRRSPATPRPAPADRTRSRPRRPRRADPSTTRPISVAGPAPEATRSPSPPLRQPEPRPNRSRSAPPRSRSRPPAARRHAPARTAAKSGRAAPRPCHPTHARSPPTGSHRGRRVPTTPLSNSNGTHVIMSSFVESSRGVRRRHSYAEPIDRHQRDSDEDQSHDAERERHYAPSIRHDQQRERHDGDRGRRTHEGCRTNGHGGLPVGFWRASFSMAPFYVRPARGRH